MACSSSALRLVLASVIIAVAAFSSVGFLIDTVQRGLQDNTAQLLGADLVVHSTLRPAPAELVGTARAAGLTTTRSMLFFTTLEHGDSFELVEVKAVGGDYPLRGALYVAGETAPRPRGPMPGEAWPDARLARTLQLRAGDLLALGALRLRVGAILEREPGYGTRLFNIAPRLLVNLEDLPRTGLARDGSRVRHRLLAAGPEPGLRTWRARLREYPALHVLGAGEAEQSRLYTGLRDARHLLSLCAYLALLLAGLVIAMASDLHTRQQQDQWALLRCLGASRRQLLGLQLGQLLGLAVCGSLLGAAAGYLGHQLLLRLLGETLALPPGQPSMRPAVTGLAVSLVLLLGCSLPRLAAAARSSPWRVLQHDLPGPTARALPTRVALLAAVLALAPWQGAQPQILVYLLPGAAAGVALLWLLSVAGLRLAARARARPGSAWQYGLANLARGPLAGRALGLGLGLGILFLVQLGRTDLLEAWRARLPADAPNYFLIDIQPGERAALVEFLGRRSGHTPPLYPVARARLAAINGRPVRPAEFQESRARGLARHEFALSQGARLPPGNRVTAGRWHGSSTAQPELSLESGVAETLGISLGDRLRFHGVGTLEARVTSLRELRWDSFQVNFYVIGSEGWLAAEPLSYITAFHLPPGHQEPVAQMKRRFPGVTVLDVERLLQQGRESLDRLSRALEFLFSFALLAGLLTLYTALLADQEERRRETALLRALGAGRGWLRRAALAEFCVLGGITGAAAALAATLSLWALGSRLFQLDLAPQFALLPVGAVLGILLAAAAGLGATRGLGRIPPLEVLRRA